MHIASQLKLSLHEYPSISNTLKQLRQVTSEAIDMAALIHLPAELFLSESEWVGARWKEERAQKAEEEKARAMGFGEPDGQGASEYLAFAIKSHQEAQAQSENSSGGYTQDDPEVLRYVLDHVANVIIDLETQRRDGALQLKLEPRDNEGEEDPRLRDLRLNLLALAKRAPLDKIQRLPAELIPEHIRHIVPTVAPLTL
jgi:bromodomain-containing protein 7/9